MNNKDHNADISKTDTIYRQSAIDALADMHCKSDEDGYVWIIRSDAWARIDVLPSAQPEIIHCRDCRWRKDQSGSTEWLPCRVIVTPSDFYCGRAERRTDGSD